LLTGFYVFLNEAFFMKITLTFNDLSFSADLGLPLDISIPLRARPDNVSAWYVKPPRIEPVVMGDWVGDVKRGGAVNFRDVYINPHGHGTHTECVGHISREDYSLNQCLKEFMFFAEVITIDPETIGEDRVITLQHVKDAVKHNSAEAIIIRTLPNNDEKLTHQYSSTNPPYLHKDATEWLVGKGIKHLLIDQPSVDREQDNGALSSHHAFWRYPGNTRTDCTISELIYVHESIADGFYLLNIQITALENDASPSKPVLYKLTAT
jgi:arylformamidase